MLNRYVVPIVSALLLAASTAGAQAAPATSNRVAADPKDVASPDAILTALYDVISGPAGKARNWDRFRSLFIDGARLIPAGVGPDGKPRIRTMTPDEYASTVGPRLEQSGFFEREISRTSQTFGNVTHAFSTYESRRIATDEKPFARGINSIQLFNDGTRWWLTTINWDSERAGNAIPERYLTKAIDDGERTAILTTVQKVFDAMRTRDTSLLSQAFDSTARLVGMSNAGGSPAVRLTAPSQFGAAIAKAPAGDVWNERMFDPDVRIDGDVAQVWAYYTFHRNSTFSHCGVDAFMLVKVGSAWKITHLADSRRTQGCTQTVLP
ncbi:MAG: DUF4440 domain-containing protein [Gemmatimonadaceae bacterium]